MSGPPPLRIDHRCRVSVLESEKLWSLRGDILWMGVPDAPAGQEMPIPLRSLVKVRLVFAPTRVQRNRFRCLLHDAGGSCGVLQNEHYKGVLDFEDRSGSYRDLVEALVRKTAAVNPACVFVTGAPLWSWLLQTAFLAAMFVLLAFVMIVMGSGVTWVIIVKLLIVLFYVPTAMAWILKNKPRVFTPPAVPEKLLPERPR